MIFNASRPDVLEATECSDRKTEVICSLMDIIAGCPRTSLEKEFLIPNAAMVLCLKMKNQECLNFPKKKPEIVLEQDPGENLKHKVLEEMELMLQVREGNSRAVEQCFQDLAG